jgi:hypothetical protein
MQDRVYSTDEQSAFAKASARPGQSPKGDGRRRGPGCIEGQDASVIP